MKANMIKLNLQSTKWFRLNKILIFDADLSEGNLEAVNICRSTSRFRSDFELLVIF
jgi:hypothetical protein